MATEAESPKREATPTGAAPTSLPQKRAFEDDHTPAVSSPLNPDFKSTKQVQLPEDTHMAREKRAKKESLKKRESKGAESSRATPDPKQGDPAATELAPMKYKLPPPKPTDFEPSQGPLFTSHHELRGLDGELVEFFEASEHVTNKKNFHYTHCIADPAFPSSLYYRHTEPEPHEAHLSFEDAASDVYFDKSGKLVTTDKGFRMARANVAVRQGRWYWECRILRGIPKTRNDGDPDSNGHVRMGWARREASLDAPIGFDAYSYGFRDVSGQKVHMSRPKELFPEEESMCEGDVIGLEIQLPSEHLQRKVVQGNYNPAVDLDDEVFPDTEAPNIVRDRLPIRFKSQLYFEMHDYHPTKELEDLMNPSPMSGSGPASSQQPNPNHAVPALRTLPNSYIKIYKNGVLMGTPFTDLLAFLPPASKPPPGQPGARDGLDDGVLGYYPAISCFRGGAAEVNFGPDFWCPPPGMLGSQGGDVEMKDADADAGDAAEQSIAKAAEARAVSERYDEQIVEDIVYDIIDEVDFWMRDGAQVLDEDARGKTETLSMGMGSSEIKELVQDD